MPVVTTELDGFQSANCGILEPVTMLQVPATSEDLAGNEMSVTPSKDYKRREREAKKRAKREAKAAEKAEKKRAAEQDAAKKP
jgi:hypothetical protein